MNATWKNEKLVVIQAGGLLSTQQLVPIYRDSEIRNYEWRKNPVRDLSLVERRNTSFPTGMPSGMEPINFLPSNITYGNDFEARAYDPVQMRFTRLDPLTEKYPGISPYAYCGNNPVNRIDPTGMDWYVFGADDNQYQEKLVMEGTHRMVVKSVDKKGKM